MCIFNELSVQSGVSSLIFSKRNSIGFQKEKERVNVAFSRAKKLLIVCGDKNFFYNFDDQDNKFVEIIDYISEEEECEIIQCDGGKLFERESNS